MSTDSGSTTSPFDSADTWSTHDSATDTAAETIVDAERLIDRERPSADHVGLEDVPMTHIDTRTGSRCGYVDDLELLVREVGGDRVGEHMSPEEFHLSGRFEPIT